MSIPRETPPGRANAPAVVVVNNVDYPVRYAAWFDRKHAKSAIRLAREAGFHVLDANDEQFRELAAQLKEGSTKGGSLSLVPVEDDLVGVLKALIKPREVAGVEANHTTETPGAALDAGCGTDAIEQAHSSEAERVDLPDELKPGALVLAANLDRLGAADAWFEAFIVRIEGPEFVLRWRDFPREGLLTRTRRHIAIPPPAE